MQGTFVADSEDDVCTQELGCLSQGSTEGGVSVDESAEVLNLRAVTLEQVGDTVLIPAVTLCVACTVSSDCVVAVCTDQADGCGHGGVLLSLLAQCEVDSVGSHDTVGGELAACDGAHAGCNLGHGVLAGNLGGCCAVLDLGLQQRAQTGVGADDVLAGQRVSDQLVGLHQDVVDVLAGCDGALAVLGVGGVGGANDPVTLPGDDEENGLLGLGEDTAGCVDAVAGNHDVNTLGCQNLQATFGVSEGLGLFGPHAGCVDDVLCAHVQALAGLQVCQLCADDAAGCVLGEADNLGAGCSQCAVACSGADDVDDEACVVNACVVELDCAAECGVLDVGEDGLGAGLGEVTLGGDALVAAGTEECEGVVHADADCGVCALDDGHLQGPQEGLCVHQVGCDLVQQQAALGQCFGHELEVEVVEVAQAAVNELGGPCAGACSPVACFDDTGAQTAGCCVEGNACTGDAAADDQDVEFFVDHALERLGAGLGGQLRLLCNVLGAHVLLFPVLPLVRRGGFILHLVKPNGEIITKQYERIFTGGLWQMNERANHTYEAAQLYYIHNMTMDAIAARLGVSRATVSRLLKSARESGMVQIRLDDSFRARSELERRIGERYKVRVTLVNVRSDATPIARMSQVSRTAAALLDSLIDNGTSLGVAWGSTMTEISRHLPRRPLKGVTVVQMNGAGNAHHSGIPYLGSLLGQLVNAYDAQTIHFPVPAFFDYADTKTAMWRERSVQKNLHAQQNVDLAIFGVGAFGGPIPSHVYSGGYFEVQEQRQLRELGVVGDMCTILLREDGSWADLELNKRASGPTPKELARIPRRICVASGTHRVRALRGALRTGAITDLVLDDALAKALMEK